MWFFAIFLAIAASLFLHVWQRAQPANVSEGEAKTVAKLDGRDPKSNRVDDHVARALFAVSLPTQNAPLKDTLADLVKLSNSGNADASLRLFSDLRKCDLRLGAQTVLNGIYYRRPGQSEADYERQIQQMLERKPELQKALDSLAVTDALCEGIGANVVQSRGDYLRKAALQHDPEAMICYVSQYEIGADYLSDAWFDYVARWRDDAPYFAQQALEAGQAGILAPLIDAYMPVDATNDKSYALSEVLRPDPVLAYALSLIYARLAHGAELQQAQNDLLSLSNALDSSQLAIAQAKADALWPRFQQASNPQNTMAPCPEFLSLPSDSTVIVPATE